MPRILQGTVLKPAVNSTAVVVVSRRKTHRIYGKQYKLDKKYLVHDPKSILKAGARVSIAETKPISKRKRWVIAPSSTTEAKK